MNYQQVMRELKALGTAQNVKVYQRHGAGDNLFGVSFANLYKLQKKITGKPVAKPLTRPPTSRKPARARRNKPQGLAKRSPRCHSEPPRFWARNLLHGV